MIGGLDWFERGKTNSMFLKKNLSNCCYSHPYVRVLSIGGSRSLVTYCLGYVKLERYAVCRNNHSKLCEGRLQDLFLLSLRDLMTALGFTFKAELLLRRW